jgi:hypothetical protein
MQMSAPVPTTADNVLELLAPSPRTSGSILWAPVGSTLPTTSYADLDGTAITGFQDLGFADDNGLKQRESRSTTDVFAWGGDLVGTLQTQYSRDLMFKLLQFRNTAVLAAAYGISNVSVVAATSTHGKEIAVKLNPKLLDTRSWVFDGIFGASLVRIVIPIGRITTVGELDMTHKAYMTTDCTLKAYPDSNKNHGYMYINDGVTT